LGFGLAQDVVGAVGDLARDGQLCALVAAAAADGGVEAPVGAAFAGGLGGLDERPTKRWRAGLGQLAARAGVG
jgi:hypothetical protein